MRSIQTNLPTFAFSVGFWPIEAVVLGRYSKHLSPRERDAIIAHEMGHIVHRHAWKRLGWLLSCRWGNLSAVCHAHEFEADAFASDAGHSPGLLAFLSRCTPTHETALHPTPRDRINRIMARLSAHLETDDASK